MNHTMEIPDAPTHPRPTGAVTLDLDASLELVEHALRLLQAARRRARRGIRTAGPDGDEVRAAVAAMATAADAELHHARVVLDRLLRTAGVESLAAPRPVIALPPAD